MKLALAVAMPLLRGRATSFMLFVCLVIHLICWPSGVVHGQESSGLPSPDHELLFGYYALEGRDGSVTEHALAYTNADVVEPGAWWVGEDVKTYTDWISRFRNQMSSSAGFGRRIHLMLGNGQGRADTRGFWPDWKETLSVAAPFWDSVAKLEIFHEDDTTPEETRSRIERLEQLLAEMQLPRKPIGGILFKKENWSVEGLDWIGIEAYVTREDAAVYTDPAAAERAVAETLTADLAAIPEGKRAAVIMMGYKSGPVTDPAVLLAVQRPAYEAARQNPKVDELLVFSYSRKGGTRDLPEVRNYHRAIGEAIRARYPHGFNQ
jgi:hypothetical protein